MFNDALAFVMRNPSPMNLSIFGTGYVGLVSGACLAEVGHNVVCMDVDPVKSSCRVDFSRPWRAEARPTRPWQTEVERNVKEGRLSFTTDAAHAVQHGQVQFIAAGTPPDEDGSADMQYVQPGVQVSAPIEY